MQKVAQLLQHLVATLRSGLREGDLLGRLGGEEFAIVLAATPGEAGREVAERLLASIRAISLKHKNKAVRVSASAGVGSTELFGLGAADPTILLLAVDAALYEAKSEGRNRIKRAGAAAPAGGIATVFRVA